MHLTARERKSEMQGRQKSIDGDWGDIKDKEAMIIVHMREKSV